MASTIIFYKRYDMCKILILLVVICSISSYCHSQDNDSFNKKTVSIGAYIIGSVQNKKSNIEREFTSNGFYQENYFLGGFGLKLSYCLFKRVEIGLLGDYPNSLGNQKSNTSLVSSEVRVAYSFKINDKTQLKPFIGGGAILSRYNSPQKSQVLDTFHNLLANSNSITLTNGWGVAKVGVSFNFESRKNNIFYSIDMGYSFGLGKEPWGVDDKNIIYGAPSDKIRLLFLSFNIGSFLF